MPYEDDPLAASLPKYFTLRDGRYYFVHRYGELPVSDEDLWLASETLRERAAIGKVLNFLLIGPTVLFLFWYWSTGHRIGWSWALFPAAFVLGLIIYYGIIWSVLHPFRKKLKEGWRRQGFRAAFEELKRQRLLGKVLACIPLLVILLVISARDYFNRNDLAHHGATASAVVIPSAKQTTTTGKRKCGLVYRFEWKGRSYETVIRDCDLEKRHPVGSRFSVYLDPAKPANSFPAGDPKLPFGIFFALGGMAFFAALFCLQAASRVPPPEKVPDAA